MIKGIFLNQGILESLGTLWVCDVVSTVRVDHHSGTNRYCLVALPSWQLDPLLLVSADAPCVIQDER